MDTWNLLKYSFKELYFSSKNAVFIDDGFQAFINKSDSKTICTVFIDNYFTFNSNPLNDIPVSGNIITFPQNKNKILELGNNVEFVKAGVVMSCNINNLMKLEKNNSISIDLVSNDSIKINDYIKIMCSEFKIDKKDIDIIFDIKKILSIKNILIFCAYFENKPIGFLEAVVKDDTACILQAYVIEKYRNNKVLSSFSEYLIDYAKNNNINRCASLITSVISARTMNAVGFLYDTPYHIWRFSK